MQPSEKKFRELLGGVTECEYCRGTGMTMRMECYGGPPIEVECYCDECDDGFVEEYTCLKI